MPETITKNDAQYAVDIVKAICSEIGPGLPCSPQEMKRASYIKKEMESHLGAVNVIVEEFSLAPDAFLSPFSTILMMLAIISNLSFGRLAGVNPWLTAIAGLTFSFFTILLFIFEFILGYEFIDVFFKRKNSANVIGSLRKPGTDTFKRLLIISGHHDSAMENAWLRYLGYGFFFMSATYFFGLLTMLAMSIIQLIGLIAANPNLIQFGIIGWGVLVYPLLPTLLFPLLSAVGRKNGGIVPGAADNLSASALSVALCRFLVDNPQYIPDETEIRFISFGSEEAGLRGSRRYVARHLDELKRLDARMLNFETVAHPEIGILTSDINGTVKNSIEMVKGVVTAAERAGVPYKVKSASLGVGTDAGSFSRAGLKATTLLPFKVPQQMVAFYHQRWDRPEILTIEPLLNVLKLSLEWIKNRGE